MTPMKQPTPSAMPPVPLTIGSASALNDSRHPLPLWHVLGAGAMGCLWAACWGHCGFPVQLLLRDRKARRAFPGWLRLERGAGEVLLCRTQAEVATAEGAPISRLLVAVKAGDVETAVASLGGRIGPNTRLLLLGNGLGQHEQLRRRLPEVSLLCAVTTDGAFLQAPFQVRQAGFGTTRIGYYHWSPDAAISGRTPAEKLATVLAELPRPLLQVEATTRLHPHLWRKFAVNCVINPLTALHGCRNGQLLHSIPLRRRMSLLCQELERLAPPGVKIQPLWPEVKQVLRATADNYSSMCQDRLHGRPTELEHLNGHLCRLARKRGIPCPEHERLLRELRPLLATSVPGQDRRQDGPAAGAVEGEV